MAFRVPTQAPHRKTSYSAPQPPPLDIPSTASDQQSDDTTQWVLFSPTAQSHTTSTGRTRTAGASRLSDFGSFGTVTRSAAGAEGETIVEDALDDPLDEDGTELDSLDDGLNAFRAPSADPTSSEQVDQGPLAMLPAHDGLGSFQASSQMVQDQIWRYEQYNPRRQNAYGPHQRRRSSVQRYLDTVNETGVDVERDRWQRIEQWRMDQNRALLQEIERETRQRRNSRTSQSSVPRSVDYTSASRMTSEAVTPTKGDTEIEESFLQRITRKVIRDLIGIDDSLLSVIFGESLPQDEQTLLDDPEKLDMETVLAREADPEHPDAPMWQSHVLQRIARELGILVHQLCEHPGAFTTYHQMIKDIPYEYKTMPHNNFAESGVSQRQSEPADTTSADTNTESMFSPDFIPTLQDANKEHEAGWGIEDEEPAHQQQEQEYWEHGLDVMMVFRYLRTRFSRRGYMASEKYSPSSPRLTQDPSRRAAVIRHHHPLVARSHSRSQPQSRLASGPVGVSSPLIRPHLRRSSSSCASQSAKLSAISSRRTVTSSSRNYWDIGGSVESSSAIGVGAGLGAWGEV
ncbi:hypothetical protein N7495_008671 [Penicillium taxi]|uniref:uncharacterized protein n=1 Tax=Penicillium taxi TaxID=168475 RepID=UPI002545B354|nr:uncharacterized protein N7495_008671 [Penicillium taxi]KAJ5888630.1 hypothetical protein N7495_008671 [Penicillium taxi]